MTASIKTRMALTARVRIRWRNSCSSGILWSDDSIFAASAVDVVRFLETGIVSSLFCWKNVTRTFYACSILSNLPLEKCLPVHNKRDGVQSRMVTIILLCLRVGPVNTHRVDLTVVRPRHGTRWERPGGADRKSVV